MKEASHGHRSAVGSVLHALLNVGLPLERETSYFVLASALDFMVTWLLLNYQSPNGHVEFVESNAIARYFLYGWGFNGLIAFKFATVGAVAGICQVIARYRIELARRVLHFATLAAMLVVVYSVVLLYRHT